ncbi:MAG: ribonuclease E inhibitor RraB [Actinomycetota bacterium]
MGLFRRRRSEFVGLTAEDRQVMTLLVEAGADLRRPRHVDHYLYFEVEDDAIAAAAEATGAGWDVRLDATDSEVPVWCLQVERHEVVLTAELLSEDRTTLRDLAARRNGEYDGWGAEV